MVLLVHAPVEWTNVFRRADELSERHAIREGQRTIDLLHVAIALEAKAQNIPFVRQPPKKTRQSRRVTE